MKKSYKVIISIIVAIVIILTCLKIKNIEKTKQDELNKNEINQEIKNEQKRSGHISIYNMTEEQIKKLPSNEIQIQSEEEAKNQQSVIQQGYVMYVNTKKGLNIRNSAGGKIVGALSNGTKINVYENKGNWSRIGTNQWVCSSYLKNYTSNYYEDTKQEYQTQYINGNYKVVASVLNVRAGAGTQYRLKTWKQLTINARIQNKKLGNEYTNGLRYGTVITVTKVKNEFGLIPSGWVCLKYCVKLVK